MPAAASPNPVPHHRSTPKPLVLPWTPSAEKLRVLGTLTAGVAHDIRNVLNGLYLRLQVLERIPAAAAHGEIGQSLVQMRQDIHVGVQLLERVQNFARPESLARPSFVDLDGVVTEACMLARARATHGATRAVIEQQLGAPPAVMGWRGELVTAVLNLVLNAIDVTPPGGRVTARTRVLPTGTWVEVQDEGPGISAEVRGHMFEAFYTTKGSHGSGLGLTTVAQCVERHGGELRVSDGPGRGAIIGIRLH